MTADLGSLLRPASIAIIGASATPDIISGLPQRILAQHRYAGAVYPVNPRYDAIDGLRCYPGIEAVPGPVDVALVVVNAERVNGVVAACGRAGVRFVVVISSGFAEQSDGGARQRELRALCDAFPEMRVLGPNAEGTMNIVDTIPLGFSPTINYDRGLSRLISGDVAVVAQSGGLGFALFNDGLGRGLGFSHVVSTGNEVDLDLADVAAHLVGDPATRVLLLFVEGLAAPERLAKIGLAARARGKHVILAKVGATAAGRRAALAHTAHDPGDAAEFARAVREGGIVTAVDQEALVDLAMVFSRTRTPAGRRVGVVTTSGGAGTWLADDLVSAGLDVPVLGPAVQERLRALIPAYGSAANPVDTTAQVLSRGGVAPVLRLVADSGEVDVLVLVATLADAKQLEREAVELTALASEVPLVVYSYTRPCARSLELAQELGIACFTSGRRTAAAVAALAGGVVAG
ncbi:CoA-binding protein [Amycolatopsis sp. NPDC004368]